eukprot:7845100-Alexandrium_andersonii.AAC.1
MLQARVRSWLEARAKGACADTDSGGPTIDGTARQALRATCESAGVKSGRKPAWAEPFLWPRVG